MRVRPSKPAQLSHDKFSVSPNLFVVLLSLLLKLLLQGSNGGLESDLSLCRALLHHRHLFSQLMNFFLLQKNNKHVKDHQALRKLKNLRDVSRI